MAYTDISTSWADLKHEGLTYPADNDEMRERTAAIGDELLAARGAYEDVNSRLTVMEALTGSGNFTGPLVGSIIPATVQPTNLHLEVSWPSGITLNKADYPDLFAVFADANVSYVSQASGTTADLEDVTFNDGRFIAIGTNKGILSTDGGVNWSNATTNPSGGMQSCAGNGLTGASAVISAVGDANIISRSTGAAAGENWSSQTSPLTGGDWNIRHVHWFGGTVSKFAAVANKDTGGSVFETKIISSADGATWAVDATIAGRYEDIAYNNNDGAVDEFLLVGYAGFGSTESAKKAAALAGAWSDVTYDGGTGFPLLTAVTYFSTASAKIFVMCGLVGTTGAKALAASDITDYTQVGGGANLRFIAVDSNYLEVVTGGELDSGTAYIYTLPPANFATGTWIPDAVGAFVLNGYAENGAGARLVVGNGGNVYRYAGVTGAQFSVPYPYTTTLIDPFKPWILTQKITGVPPSGDAATDGLNTWAYIQVSTNAVNYVRGIRVGASGAGDTIFVAFGDAGLLAVSTDLGVSWDDRTTALGISGTIVDVTFRDDGWIGVTNGTEFFFSNDLLQTKVQGYSGALGASIGAIWFNPVASSGAPLANRIWMFTDETTLYNRDIYDPDTYLTLEGSTLDANQNQYESTTTNDYQPGLVKGGRIVYRNGMIIAPLKHRATDALPSSGSIGITSDLDRQVPLLLGQRGDANGAGVPSTITATRIRNLAVSEAWGETLVCCDGGNLYKTDADITSDVELLSLGTTHDLMDATWLRNLWIVIGRRGVWHSSDTSTFTYLQDAVSASSIASDPNSGALVTNALDRPGHIRRTTV